MSDFDPERIFREVVAAGEEWADKKSAYEAYDDNTKSVLARIATDCPPGMSKVAAEQMALASETFRAHLEEKQAARRAYLLAQVKYRSLEMLAELRRSQESTRRAEISLR